MSDMESQLNALLEAQARAVTVGDPTGLPSGTMVQTRRRGMLLSAAACTALIAGIAIWVIGRDDTADEQVAVVSTSQPTSSTTVDEESGAPPTACGIQMFDGSYSGAMLITGGSLSYAGETTEPIGLFEVAFDGDVEVIVPPIVDVAEGTEVVDDTSRLWFRRGERLIDVDAMRRNEVQGDVLQLGVVVEMSDETALFLTQAIAPVAPDGSVQFMGECGDEVQRDLQAGAERLGRRVDVEFVEDILHGDHSVLAAMEEAAAVGVPDEREDFRQLWLDTPAEQRSLRLEDVPVEERGSYDLLVLAIRPTGLAAGPMVGVMTDAGVLQVFAPGSEITAPVMIPRGDGEIRIARAATGPGLFEPGNVIGTYPLSVFDPATGGAALEFVDSAEGPQPVLRPLADGELEQITGMTRAELEAQRDRLLER